jgi:hypothetical protein
LWCSWHTGNTGRVGQRRVLYISVFLYLSSVYLSIYLIYIYTYIGYVFKLTHNNCIYSVNAMCND